MLTLDIGPLALSVSHALLLGSLLLATLVGWLAGRRCGCNPERQLFRMLLAALLIARLAFVVVYADFYRDGPWQVVDIRDGGFIAWPGLLAGLSLGAWYVLRDARLRKPLGLGLSVGLALWLGGSYLMHALEQGTRLPDLHVQNEHGATVSVRDYAGGESLGHLVPAVQARDAGADAGPAA